MACFALAALVTSPVQAEGVTLHALMVSNGQAVFKEIIAEFERTHPGVKVVAAFVGAQEIESKVIQHADVDIVYYGTSSSPRMEPLVDSSSAVAMNHEIIIVAKGKSIKSLKDLAAPGIKLGMGTPDSGHGKYARQVLAKASAAYGAEFEAKVLANVKSLQPVNKDVVADVASGTVDAAIAFGTDAENPNVSAVEIPQEYNVSTTYHVAVPKTSKNAALAREFVALTRGAGQAVFKAHHFDLVH